MKIIKLTEMYLRERNLAYYTKIHFRFVARLFVKDMNISEIQLVTHESLICWREKVLDEILVNRLGIITCGISVFL